MALTAQRTAMEAARGALLAVHAAAGLSAGANLPEATRICRAAEGLLRTAVAALSVPPRASASASPAVVPPAAAPRRRRRPRARRTKRNANAMDEDASLTVPAEESRLVGGTGGEKRGRDASPTPGRKRAGTVSSAAAAGAPSSSGSGQPQLGSEKGKLAWLPLNAKYTVRRVVSLVEYDAVKHVWNVMPHEGFGDDEWDLMLTGVPVAHLDLLPVAVTGHGAV